MKENKKELFIVRGLVSSGKGVGRVFTSLPWFKEHVRELLKFEPYPGTLNIVLSGKNAERLAEMLDKHTHFRVPPRNGYLPGRLYRAIIANKIRGAIIRPEISEYPENLIEIIAPVCLRETLSIKDGDEIEILLE
ncbi:MAG: DUF120 domain-containing protein [Candidatus Bathyarchaeia archaeon]